MTDPREMEKNARIGELLRAQQWLERINTEGGVWISEAELDCFMEATEVYEENIEWAKAYVFAEVAMLKAMMAK